MIVNQRRFRKFSTRQSPPPAIEMYSTLDIVVLKMVTSQLPNENTTYMVFVIILWMCEYNLIDIWKIMPPDLLYTLPLNVQLLQWM